jgi:hypothetical protein
MMKDLISKGERDMSIIQQGLSVLKNLLNFDMEPSSIREDIVQQVGEGNIEQTQQEIDNTAVVKQTVPEITLDSYQGEETFITLPETNKLEDFDLSSDYVPDFSEEEMVDEAEMQRKMNEETIGMIQEDTLGSIVSPQQARKDYVQELKAFENPNKKGFVSSETGKRFMPIKSSEGRGPDKSMSDSEIGYGIKIPEKWLSNNPKDWPMIDGLKVNVREGITEQQAESLMNDMISKSYDSASKKLSTWEDMTEREKVFWADLTYNGGDKAIYKNPSAKAAADKGYTVEGMILALDFIRSGGKRSRGLLRRRLNMYNQAALEMSGVPIVEQYDFSDAGINLKFSTPFMTDKVSKKFKKKVDSEGWYHLVGSVDKKDVKSYQANLDYQFKE